MQNEEAKSTQLNWQHTRAAVLDSLTTSSLQSDDHEVAFAHVCEKFNEANFRVARGHVSITTLHPVLNAIGVTWTSRSGASRHGYAHGGIEKPAWRDSPFSYMLLNDLDRLRVPLLTANGDLNFPVFDEFRASGLTDWLAVRAQFHWNARHLPLGSLGMFVSWATDAGDGFDVGHTEFLESLTPSLAATFKSLIIEHLSREVLSAYLGGDAAERVLSGAITRGSITDVSAAIMIADVRGFTAMGERLARADLIALLNQTFDTAARPIRDLNGQILKFMGDGFLAVFLTGKDKEKAVRSAFQAALQIQKALPETIELDIAIHIGEVTYGNIGAFDRLDFTVVGSAVNQTARIEALCSSLGYPVLVSDGAARFIAADLLVPVGRHALKGFAERMLLFAPRALRAK